LLGLELRGPCLLALYEEVAQVERWGVIGEGFEDLEGGGGLALGVPLGLKLFVAVEVLAELEELTVLCGGEVGR
jgi:hypothetical protein